jgi:hypothetical protein
MGNSLALKLRNLAKSSGQNLSAILANSAQPPAPTISNEKS